jgi:hypothetical protein
VVCGEVELFLQVQRLLAGWLHDLAQALLAAFAVGRHLPHSVDLRQIQLSALDHPNVFS